MIVLGGGRHYAQRARITALALKHRLPGIYQARAFVEAGGLISYGPDLRELVRHAARYVDKILLSVRGESRSVQVITYGKTVLQQPRSPRRGESRRVEVAGSALGENA